MLPGLEEAAGDVEAALLWLRAALRDQHPPVFEDGGAGGGGRIHVPLAMACGTAVFLRLVTPGERRGAGGAELERLGHPPTVPWTAWRYARVRPLRSGRRR